MIQPRNIKAILFDLDGTLCDLARPFPDIFAECLASYSAAYAERSGQVLTHWTQALISAGVCSADAILAQGFRGAGIEPPDNLSDIVRSLSSRYAPEVHLFPKVHEVLETLGARYPLALVTNGPFDMQSDVIERLGIRRYFNCVAISGDERIGMRKPAKEIFHHALRKLNVEPHCGLMVGNDSQADVQGAVAAGMQAVLIGDATGLNGLRSIAELPELLL